MIPHVDDIKPLVLGIMRKHGVLTASVFGSVARGDASDLSDIDFLVEFENGRSLLDLVGLRLDLADILRRKVDVVTPQSLHPGFRESVLAERVQLI
ncbi:nucleotidyltransferase family protein [bacterium]|nr:nucleotidyltransferase family protein [bacterium]